MLAQRTNRNSDGRSNLPLKEFIWAHMYQEGDRNLQFPCGEFDSHCVHHLWEYSLIGTELGMCVLGNARLSNMIKIGIAINNAIML